MKINYTIMYELRFIVMAFHGLPGYAFEVGPSTIQRQFKTFQRFLKEV